MVAAMQHATVSLLSGILALNCWRIARGIKGAANGHRTPSIMRQANLRVLIMIFSLACFSRGVAAVGALTGFYWPEQSMGWLFCVLLVVAVGVHTWMVPAITAEAIDRDKAYHDLMCACRKLSQIAPGGDRQ